MENAPIEVAVCVLKNDLAIIDVLTSSVFDGVIDNRVFDVGVQLYDPKHGEQLIANVTFDIEEVEIMGNIDVFESRRGELKLSNEANSISIMVNKSVNRNEHFNLDEQRDDLSTVCMVYVMVVQKLT